MLATLAGVVVTAPVASRYRNLTPLSAGASRGPVSFSKDSPPPCRPSHQRPPSWYSAYFTCRNARSAEPTMIPAVSAGAVIALSSTARSGVLPPDDQEQVDTPSEAGVPTWESLSFCHVLV